MPLYRLRSYLWIMFGAQPDVDSKYPSPTRNPIVKPEKICVAFSHRISNTTKSCCVTCN